MVDQSPFGNLKAGTRVRYGMWNGAKRAEEIHEGLIVQVNRHRNAQENEGYYINKADGCEQDYIGVLGIKSVIEG
jgi:hypothetical protein